MRHDIYLRFHSIFRAHRASSRRFWARLTAWSQTCWLTSPYPSTLSADCAPSATCSSPQRVIPPSTKPGWARWSPWQSPPVMDRTRRKIPTPGNGLQPRSGRDKKIYIFCMIIILSDLESFNSSLEQYFNFFGGGDLNFKWNCKILDFISFYIRIKSNIGNMICCHFPPFLLNYYSIFNLSNKKCSCHFTLEFYCIQSLIFPQFTSL